MCPRASEAGCSRRAGRQSENNFQTGDGWCITLEPVLFSIVATPDSTSEAEPVKKRRREVYYLSRLGSFTFLGYGRESTVSL